MKKKPRLTKDPELQRIIEEMRYEAILLRRGCYGRSVTYERIKLGPGRVLFRPVPVRSLP